MTPPEEKKVLRKSLLARRFGLNALEVKEYSEEILNTLSVYVDWQEVKSLHVYLPIKENNEVDTGGLIALLGENYPDIKIETAPQKPGTDTPQGKTYDLVIVPVLGFDRRGFRLGYGGGYYDKFLARNDCKQVVGLAYSISEVVKLPNEPHDQKIPIIITEKEIVKAI